MALLVAMITGSLLPVLTYSALAQVKTLERNYRKVPPLLLCSIFFQNQSTVENRVVSKGQTGGIMSGG